MDVGGWECQPSTNNLSFLVEMFVGDVMIFIVRHLGWGGLKNYRMDLQSINGAGCKYEYGFKPWYPF